MYHILCFGDSNTYGYNGETGGRFGYEERWTGRLARLLGSNFLVTEEGLNGRTSGFPEPGKEYRNSLPYLTPCLLSHMPLDLVIVMLGTNDTKEMFHATARDITLSMRKLLLRTRNYLRFMGGPESKVLLVAPVPMNQNATATPMDFNDESIEKSRQLAPFYQSLADKLEICFWDAGTAGIPLCSDGCHFSPEGHRIFAENIAKKIRELSAY